MRSGVSFVAQSVARTQARGYDAGIMSCGISSFSGLQIREPEGGMRVCTIAEHEWEYGLREVLGGFGLAQVLARLRSMRPPISDAVRDSARLTGCVDELLRFARNLPEVEHVLIRCHETRGKRCYGDSSGNWKEEEYRDNFIDLTLVLAGGAVVPIRWGSGAQPVSAGTLSKRLQRVSSILSLPVRPLDYRGGRVMLEPDAAALLIHEVYGHALEADVGEPCRLLGTKLGSAELSLSDDPTIPGLRASYLFDAEGQMAVRTELIRHGIVTGYLHSLGTAKENDCTSTGNSRTPDFRFRPTVRMSVLDIRPSDTSIRHLRTEAGVAVIDAIDAHTDGEMFCLRSSLAVALRRGHAIARIPGVVLSGPCTRVVVEKPSRERIFVDYLQCVKDSSEPLPVSCISPGLLVSGVDIEGIWHEG